MNHSPIPQSFRQVAPCAFLLLSLVLPVHAVTAEASVPPNLIVFIADDVNWDDLGCYGNADVQTPVIDQLASDGLRFEHAFLTISSCSPTRNSIMAGRYPHNTGAAELHTSPPIEMDTFPEQLRKAGYYTVHSGKWHQGANVERGFEVIARDYKAIGNSGSDDWVNQVRQRPLDRPFFAWFAALDAHRDWGPNDWSGTHDPETITVPDYLVDAPDTRRDLCAYYDEIKRFDHRIGEVVEVLKQQDALENTVLVILSDNGRAFPHSKTRVNDRGVRTPLVVHWPEGVEAGGVCTSLVSVIDLAPTLVELAGAEPLPSFQGRSFVSLLQQPEQPFRSVVFAEHNWHDYEAHERMARTRDWLYIRNHRPQFPQQGPADAVGSPTMQDLRRAANAGTLTTRQADALVVPRAMEELYDLSSDPDQWLNVAASPEHREALQQMRALLDRWMQETGDTVPAMLTPSHFTRDPGYIRTHAHGLRGEMPGTSTNATQINEPGPF